MRRVAPILILTLTLLAPHGAGAAAPSRTPRSLSFTPHEVVVIVTKGLLARDTGAVPRSSNARLESALRKFGLEQARIVGPAARPGSKPSRPEVWLLSSARPGFDPVGAARALQSTGGVRAACPNYRFGLFNTPDDLYLIYQWYVDDSGYADIGLPFAWDVETGDPSVVIAIVDTGVDTGHPDLSGKIWHNPGEIAGNGFDDDGNGLIDDFQGWDFGTGDKDPNPERTSDASGIDVGFHGTFCAGIAAAATNNGDGIAGAGWNCRIMPLKVSHPDSGITAEAIAGAFEYAADQGASVISMSFGGPGDPGVPEFFQELVDLATQSGALCVAAAGNDGDSVRTYPAACENVLAVAATDFDNARADFSNWGEWVDVAAPGSLMWSTISRNYQVTVLDSLLYVFLFNWDTVNPYMYGNGTSFACPLTAGVCGLVRSRYPYLTPELAARHVIATGDEVAFDNPIGPKVNAFRAVNLVPTAVAVAPRAPNVGVRAAPNPIVGSGSIRFELVAAGRVRLSLYDAAGRRVRELADGRYAAGPHALPWDGRNDRGSPLAAGVYFARLETPGAVVTSKVVLLERAR
jgi:subtilisin family serine protease